MMLYFRKEFIFFWQVNKSWTDFLETDKAGFFPVHHYFFRIYQDFSSFIDSELRVFVSPRQIARILI